MAHMFDGTWSYFNIAQSGFPPNGPVKGSDFNLVIDNAGRIDPALSNVDGRTVRTGRATARTIDIEATDGRHYHGHLVKQSVVSSQLVFTIAGRYRDPAPPEPTAKTGKRKIRTQNEGTWVITKP